ncbi:MAG: hypothetical protein RLZZ44_1116 [Bacteroidota bacterium]|jgi:type IX secretion system PorP/SprF family membrane protein
MKYIYIIFLLAITANTGLAQQQSMYGQYMFNMLNVNPAYAGSRGIGNVNALVRRQWLDINGSPTTGTFSYDERLTNKNTSLGGQMYYDNIYTQKRAGIQGYYAYAAEMGSSTLSLGMSFGVMNYNANYFSTNPFDVGDPLVQQVVSAFLPTAGLGAYWSAERWYLGLSTPNLFKSYKAEMNDKSVSFAGKSGYYYLTGGYVFPLSDMVVVKPSVMLKSVSGVPVQIDFNTNVWFSDVFGLGASYRTGDAMLGMVELQLNTQFRIGYAYEQKIKVVNTSSHELMMRYEFGGLMRKKVLSPRYF